MKRINWYLGITFLVLVTPFVVFTIVAPKYDYILMEGIGRYFSVYLLIVTLLNFFFSALFIMIIPGFRNSILFAVYYLVTGFCFWYVVGQLVKKLYYFGERGRAKQKTLDKNH